VLSVRVWLAEGGVLSQAAVAGAAQGGLRVGPSEPFRLQGEGGVGVRKTGLLLIAMLVMVPALAGADSIVPASYSTTIAVGGTATLSKTVTVGQVATGAIDVFFLADTTGSMFDALSSVQTEIKNIINEVAPLASNVAYGVGEYKDVGDGFVYRENLDPPSLDGDTVKSAVDAWLASGGGDLEEAQLYALEQVANGTTWRDGSQRLVMWFGDAPGHDPRLGSTEASATAALLGASAKVYAMSVGFDQLDSTGQATRIAAATGGSFTSGIPADGLANIIKALIDAAVKNYSVVSLDVIGLAPGLAVSFTPASYVGAFDRSIDRLFGFDVGFTGIAPGVYNFEIVARVDGGIVARESDTITVTGEPVIPEPATLLLLGTGLAGMAKLRRRR
jgi:hypothetical protein